jgi:hypothetical protein
MMTEFEMTVLNLALGHLSTITCILDAGTSEVLAEEYFQATTVLEAFIELCHVEDGGMSAEAVERMVWLEKQYAEVMRAAATGKPVIKRDRSKLN